MSKPCTSSPLRPSFPAHQAPTCGYKVCIKQGCHGRYPEGLLQAWLPVKPMSFSLEGKWPLLGEAPQGHRAVGEEGNLRGKSRTKAYRREDQAHRPAEGYAPRSGRQEALVATVVRHIRKEILPIICTRHHVFLVDQMDAVNGTPRKRGYEGQGPALSLAHRARHSPADCLTGGHRRQAETPLGSSTHAQSRPGPRLSHSTLGSRRPMQPQHPGARSWREEQSRKGGCHM